jgi:hypothetical protein
MIRKKPAPHLMRGAAVFPPDKRETRLRGDPAPLKSNAAGLLPPRSNFCNSLVQG